MSRDARRLEKLMCLGLIPDLFLLRGHPNAFDDVVQEVAANQVMVPVELDEREAEIANLEHLRNRAIREMEILVRKREDVESEKFDDIMSMLTMCFVHPVTVVRTCIQLGFEPFPTTSDGYLPNLFSYGRSLSQLRNWSTLYQGVDSAVCNRFVGEVVDSYLWKYVKHNPEFELRRPESLQSLVRYSLKFAFVDIITRIATRPFKVIMYRQIACIIGDQPSFSTLQGLEMAFRTSWRSLFSGLRAELCNALLAALLSFGARHVINRLYHLHYRYYATHRRRTEEAESTYETAMNVINKVTANGIIEVFQSTVGCPLEVISRTRAVADADWRFPVTYSSVFRVLTETRAFFRAARWFYRTD